MLTKATDLKMLLAEKVLMSDIDVQQKSAHLWKSAHPFLLISQKSAHLMVLIDEQKQMSNSNYCDEDCIVWFVSNRTSIQNNFKIFPKSKVQIT